MIELVRFLSHGTVTSPSGFHAGAAFAGMKTYAEDKLDIGILYSDIPCSSAGVFTTNQIKSQSLVLTKKHVLKGAVRAVVANSGIANAAVGKPGEKDSEEVIAIASTKLGIPSNQVAFLSTGIIGVELPMALIRGAMPKIQLSPSGGNAFARAIMTTDTHPKEAAVSYTFKGRTVTIGGVAKGSGMIHPNMATMLSFLATDAPVDASFLRKALRIAADCSFNMISIDGDTSSNDSVLLLANGMGGGSPIQQDSEEAPVFQEALNQICIFLGKQIVKDGEGVSKLFEVKVEGARSDKEAKIAARTVTSSNLVKTAVHGNDPNWGRIIVALGRSGARVNPDKLALYVNDVCIMEKGVPIPFFKDSIVLLMKNEEIYFRINLNVGEGSATAWGCNLSEAYVTFNSAYTT